MTGATVGGASAPGDGRASGRAAGDALYAGAIASLPLMTPARLARVLGDRRAADVWTAICQGDRQIVEELGDLKDIPEYELVAGEDGRGRRGGKRMLTAPELVSRWAERAGDTSITKLHRSWTAAGISAVRHGDPRYPWRLADDAYAPLVLFVRGDCSIAGGPAVAIVGTRKATHYGMNVAAELGAGLARAGVCVVSGLAAGIDGAAHQGALGGWSGTGALGQVGDLGPAGGGDPDGAVEPCGTAPFGVVAGGVDVAYPAQNARLIERVASAGCLISESRPGARPERWRFPLRNRIIAALAQVLVVVESQRSGGSMHTVEAALARGREVMPVPGSIYSAASDGTNELLAAGMPIARCVDDVLVAVERACRAEGVSLPNVAARPQLALFADAARTEGDRAAAADIRKARLEHSSELERRVHDALEDVPLGFDIVCQRAGADIAPTALALDRLLELGLAEPVGGKWRRT